MSDKCCEHPDYYATYCGVCLDVITEELKEKIRAFEARNKELEEKLKASEERENPPAKIERCPKHGFGNCSCMYPAAKPSDAPSLCDHCKIRYHADCYGSPEYPCSCTCRYAQVQSKPPAKKVS